MRKIILAALFAIPFIFTGVAYAASKDKTTVEHTAKKKHKHHKHVKRAVLVEDKFNAFLKDCGLFGCMTSTRTAFNTPFNTQEISTSEYFLQEYDRQHRKPQQVAKKEEKHCGFFERCNSGLAVYEEAKRWEGKTAMANRQEIKALLAEGNNNKPVDPNRIPWCAAFANAILNREGYSTTGSLAARSFLALNHKTKNPEVGDIVVLRRGHGNASGHVGFFEGYENYEGVTYVKVLGGNTSKSIATGWFPVNAVLGYRKIG